MNIHDFVAVVNKYNLRFSCMDFQQYKKFKNGLPERSRFIPVLFEIYGTSKLKSHYEKNVLEIIFVTNKKSTATKYCTKFNKLLKKWQDHYEQFETKKYGIMMWLADEHIDKFSRWNKLQY